MAKRRINKTRKGRTYRKKTNRVSNRKRINKKKTVKRKNINSMIKIGGGDGIVSTIGDPQKVFIGQPQFNINGITGFLSEFGILGGSTFDSMMVTTNQIKDLFTGAAEGLKKVSGKAMGVLKSFNTPVNQETGQVEAGQASQVGGGPPGLKWLLKKILGVSIGGLIKIFWYFFIQPDIDNIFESINNKFIFTYNRKYSLIGITSIYDGKLKQFHLKNDNKSFPLYINLKDVIDMFLPILINYAYSIKNFQKLLDAIGIKTEEEFLIKLMGELKERDNQGGGGSYLKEKYHTTKGKLVGAKDDAKKYLHTKSDQVKKFIGERMETITSFGSDMANTIVIFLIFHIIFYIYENAVDTQGRWVQFGMSNDKFGIFIKKGDLNSTAEFIALTGHFKEGNKDETIKQKIKESEDKDKKLETKLEEGSEEEAKAAAKTAAGDSDEVDAGVAVGPQSQTPDTTPESSSQPDSPPSGTVHGLGEVEDNIQRPQVETEIGPIKTPFNPICEHCNDIKGLFKDSKKKECINKCRDCKKCDPRDAAGFQTLKKEKRKECWENKGCQGKSP